MKYKVIDLFAGVGGMSLGFEMAGFDVVLANEYDKDIATAYKKNHSLVMQVIYYIGCSLRYKLNMLQGNRIF